MIPAPPDSARLVDRYLAISDAMKRFESEREDVRALLVDALGERRGTFGGARGSVRVLERPTCRILAPQRVLGGLDDAGFLRDVATLQPTRLRHAMEGDLAIARVVAPFVESATYTYVGAVPGGRSSSRGPQVAEALSRALAGQA